MVGGALDPAVQEQQEEALKEEKINTLQTLIRDRAEVYGGLQAEGGGPGEGNADLTGSMQSMSIGQLDIAISVTKGIGVAASITGFSMLGLIAKGMGWGFKHARTQAVAEAISQSPIGQGGSGAADVLGLAGDPTGEAMGNIGSTGGEIGHTGVQGGGLFGAGIAGLGDALGLGSTSGQGEAAAMGDGHDNDGAGTSGGSGGSGAGGNAGSGQK